MFRPAYVEDDDYYNRLYEQDYYGSRMRDGYDALAAQRLQETLAMEDLMAQPNRFHEYRNTLTPPIPGSPYTRDYESYSPAVMGQHTADFAWGMGLPFDREDHRIRTLADDEFLSTLPPAAWNEGPTLRGVFDDDFGRHPALLTEPVYINPNIVGFGHREDWWPEGAIDYVGQYLGRSELEENWHRYSVVPGEYATEEYVRNKKADPGWSPVESAFWQWDLEGRW